MAATTSDSDRERKKMITLISLEGESFETTEAAAAMSTTIANMIEDGSVDESGVRIPKVISRILAKVLEYCNKHAATAENTNSGDSEEAAETNNSGDSEDAAENTNSGESEDAASASEDLESFDAEFINEDDMETLYNLLLAANFLDIKGLLDLCVQATADMIKGKMPEEIREKFGIANDFTKEEEEEEIRNENVWAFH